MRSTRVSRRMRGTYPVDVREISVTLAREVIPAISALEQAHNVMLGDLGGTATAFASAQADGATRLLLVDASAGPVFITLPEPAAMGAIMAVKKIDPTANPVTIVTPGFERIDGTLNYTLTAQYEVVRIDTDGANFWVVG